MAVTALSGRNKKMATGRTIVVGDVHGCFEELMLLLEKCEFEKSKDELIFVGDILNKGPKSFETLQFVQQNSFQVVVGNHELKFLKLVNENGPIRNSSMSTLIADLKDRYGKAFKQLTHWIESWPKYIEKEGFIVVHGGLQPGLPPQETPVEILATIRTWDGKGKDLNCVKDPAWHELYKGKKLVIYGHWAVQGLCVKENSIGLDTGCVYGRSLSAVILPERRIVQVPALETYVEFVE